MQSVLHKIARALSTSKQNTNVSCQEIRIPVPWGYISGKWWGPQDKRPILAIHGRQDNCGVFDLLIPELPQQVGYLAIDLAGHGRSSWLPSGMFYHHTNAVMTIRYLQKHMNWDKISLMGHSFGAITSYGYGSLYPQEIDFMICLQDLEPSVDLNVIKKAGVTSDEFLKSCKEQSSCTPEEMALHLHKEKSLNLDKCHYILDRNVNDSWDPRLKYEQMINWSDNLLQEAATRVTFPLLFAHGDSLRSYSQHLKALEILKEKNREFQRVCVQEDHYGLLNNPEQFVPVLSDFVMKHDKSDRSKGRMFDAIKFN